MRFSRNWIATYVDLPDSEDELSEALSALGLVVDEMKPVGSDLIFDLDVASNRPDVMNHVGVARELAIRLKVPLRAPTVTLEATGPATSELAGIELSDPEDCIRFVARAIVDVEVAPSPAWLVERLESIGLRSINNVVDVTNFVMWETGRPMHAYDLDKLDGHRLQVRRAHAGETVVTLDEIERKLDAEDLVIADASRPVGLAGLMGGATTGVVPGARRVLLECACFHPSTVRAMARRHGMHTDASHRFERGMSHQGILAATDRAASLIQELAGGRVAADVIDARGPVPEPTVLEFPIERVRGLLGIEVPSARVLEILEQLGFGAEVVDGDRYRVSVPAERVDVTRPVDVVEEIARFHGYEKLPSTLPLLRRADSTGLSPSLRHERRIKKVCSALGYWEATTLAFSTGAEQSPFLESGEEVVALENPLSEAMAVLRARLLPGLVAAVARNRNHGERRVRLFELAHTFREHPNAGSPPVERVRLALVASGEAAPRHHEIRSRAFGLADLRGALDALAARMRWPELVWEEAAAPGLQEGASARVECDCVRGIAGKLHPAVADSLGLDEAVWVAELDVSDALGRTRSAFTVTPAPRFPSSERDVSLMIPVSARFAEVQAQVAGLSGLPLSSVELIDLYRGDDLPDGQMAMTLRFTYRALDRTLTAEEIESAHETVVSHLEGALEARRR